MEYWINVETATANIRIMENHYDIADWSSEAHTSVLVHTGRDLLDPEARKADLLSRLSEPTPVRILFRIRLLEEQASPWYGNPNHPLLHLAALYQDNEYARKHGEIYMSVQRLEHLFLYDTMFYKKARMFID